MKLLTLHFSILTSTILVLLQKLLKMLKISKLADYSAVIMTYLASNKTKQSARKIADNTKIAYPTVNKLLKILIKNDFLNSSMGNAGGYELAKPADEISLLDIIHSIEGDILITDCSKNITNCDIFDSCGVSSHWRAINSSIKDALQDVTLHDLALGKNNRISADQNNLDERG